MMLHLIQITRVSIYLLSHVEHLLINKVVFLWIWIPNEQRISFRWFFQHTIPIIIPKYIRDCVQFTMKDGDAQQRNEILYTLLSIFPNAKEGGCGWHIGQSYFVILTISIAVDRLLITNSLSIVYCHSLSRLESSCAWRDV